ncbi:hypothetical protein EMIHUDRAFT_459950 [Emiliania huxleyi CCMP1516]|uniref:Threonine/serine exporter-like N-terminal domain-containing protein n=2 Tax=Emiliania huxleyi TaxID=2903 RepID=A0A0D3IBT5_EMIH1|nr:hypothetical protein EMIHUDRAFT_459950 [Emiliania huxleyi CCMP1516]EOD08720.1 hypothetical protein EMIHUDRAFT_459950 [Emiliania huxleyi CCMP1516]|eukprot:XP_005761149.1 hypothetical protein EMIHUDRAFT_459950 [Emiliania huxleyi CCMP1516]
MVDHRAEPLLPAEEAGKLRSALRIDLSVGCSRGGVLQPCRRKHEPPSREARAQLPLGPNEHATEGDICDMYARLGWDERDQLGAVLVLKLALSLTASGMPTYTAEPLLRTVAAAANLPHCHLLLGMRSLQISFGGGPVHVLSSRQGKVLHRLSDLHCLTLAVAVAVEPATLMALQAVDAINRRRSPFGWAIEALAYHGFACAAAPAIFGGGLGDFAVVALASVPVRLTLAACGALPQLSALSDLLLPIVAGVAAPSLCALFELDACHAATATLSLLLFELPGSELLFGATELKRGNLVGATRLVHAVVLTMFMAVALALGWCLAALPISRLAPSPPPNPWLPAAAPCSGGATAELWPALLQNGLQLLPLEVSFFVLLGVSVREMPSAAGLLLLTMLLQFFLSHSALPLPGPVSNAATLFVGTALGCAHEYVHGTSHLIVLLPTIVLLAPGATVLKARAPTAQHLRVGAAEPPPTDAWFELLMLAVSFAVGEAIAHHLWAPALSRRAAARAEATAVALSDSKAVCPVRLARIVAVGVPVAETLE